MPQNAYDALLQGKPANPSGNPYDSILDDMAGKGKQAQTEIKTNVRAAAKTAPDAKADALKTAERLNVPVELVERNPDFYKQQSAIESLDYESLLSQTPSLAEWLKNPTNAALGKDDLDNLQKVEQSIGFGKRILRGIDTMQSMLYGGVEVAGQLTGAQSVARYGQAGRERNIREAEAIGPGLRDIRSLEGPWDLVQFAKEAIGEQIPMLGTIAASSAAGAAVGAPFGGIGAIPGATIGAAIGAFVPTLVLGTGEVQQSIKEKDPTAEAPVTALIGGSFIAALDSVLPGRIGSRLVRTFGREAAEEVVKRALAQPVKQAFVRRAASGAVSGMATEGLTEALQEAIGEVAAASGVDQPIDWKTLPGQMLNAGAVGAIVGGAAGGVEVAATHRREQARIAAAQQQAAFFQQLGEGVANSKTAQRMPQAVQALVDVAVKDGPVETVYAPIDTFTQYWQSKGIDPATIATELTGDADAFAQAQATGSDLAIPTSAYAVKLAATEHNAFFANELRFSPEMMNAREATEYAQSLADAQTVNEPGEPAQAPGEAIRGAMVERLEAAGVERSVAEQYSTLYEQAFGAIASRAGLDPLDLFNRYGLTVGREALDSPTARVQTVPGADSGAEGAGVGTREGGRPSVRRVEASTPLVRREGVRARAERREQHYTDVFGAVLDAARSLDPAVDETALRAEFDDRVSFLESLDAEFQESGYNPRALLEAIAAAGGISIDAEEGGGFTGELRQLRESDAVGPFGNFGGVPNVFRRRARATETSKGSGFPLDVIVQRIRQSPEFQHIEDADDLLAALGDVARMGDVEKGVTFPGTDELARQAGVTLTERWWLSPEERQEFEQGAVDGPSPEYGAARAAHDQASRAFSEATASYRARTIGDAEYLAAREAFNRATAEFDAAFEAEQKRVRPRRKAEKATGPTLFDTLDTGEAQPRLPGAEDVREQEIATPEFELPFSLTAPVSKAKKGKQDTLFQSATEFNQALLASLEPAEPGDSRVVPFPVADAQLASQLFRAADHSQDHVERIPLTALVATQRTISESKAEAKLEGEQPPIPVVEFEGKYYVMDGTHRATAAWAKGEQTIEAMVAPVNPDLLVNPPPYRSFLDGRSFNQDAKDLVITHNLTAANLLHAERMGGLPVPSFAITRKGESITGFGEITLIGDAKMADPQGYAKTQVFGADVYSPRYPTIHYKISTAGEKALSAFIKKHPEGGQQYVDLDSLQKEGAKYLARDSGAVIAGFLKERGIDVPPAVVDEKYSTPERTFYDSFRSRYQLEHIVREQGLQAELDEYAEALFESLNPTEHIFKGFTNQGNRSYAAHTLENVVKILIKELRGGEVESNIYGIGQLRSKFTPKFRSVAAIRKAKDRLVSDEQFENVKKEVEGEFFAIANELEPYYSHGVEPFRFTDTVLAVMEDAPKRGLAFALKDYGFVDVPADAQSDIGDFLSKLRTLPTEYFEAKILRDVDLSEFAAAVVPEGTSDRVIDALKRRGVAEIATYAKGDNAARQKAVESVADKLGERVLFQNDEQRRGFIRFGENRQINIGLLEKADLSTFLHESGHFFLEVLQDVAAESSAIAKDLDTLRAWFGTDTIDREQHEQFARGFEAYLMEGKAPSVELRSVFARFRSWLIGVYRSLTNLHVDLTPEVRGVFDRLVATDEQITAAESEAQVAPLFPDAASAGLTDQLFADYQTTVQRASDAARDDVQARLMDEWKRERLAWWKAEENDVRAAVAESVHARPVYRALFAIRRGTHPDGTSLVDGADPVPMKLSKDALAALVGADNLTPYRQKQLYAVKNGVHPETVAELFGFSSADEMLKALLAAPDMKAVIQQETDTYMKEKHGDLLSERDTLRDLARGAVHQARFEVVSEELRLLSAKAAVRGAIPPADVIRQAAKTRIAGMTVRNLRPGLYLTAAQRESRKAFELVAAGKHAQAIRHKQAELLNLALYREASDAQQDADSARDYMRTFETKAVRERLGKAGWGFLEQIDGFLDRYEFARISNIQLDKRAGLRKWVATLEGQGLPVDLPEAVLEDARRVNWRELTVDELRGVRDAVQQLAHLARLKNKLLKNKAKRELDAVASELDTSIREHATKAKGRRIETRLPSESAARMVEGFFASHRKLASWAREFDGFKDGGAMWDAFIRPINDAGDREAEMNADATMRLSKIIEKAYPSKDRAKLYQKRHIPAIGTSLSKMGRLMIALNWGNEGNRQRVQAGYGWSPEQVQAVLDTLDATDARFVQDVLDFVNSYWPEIAAKQKRVTGVEPEKVDASPFRIGGVQMKGGYFPLSYDDRQSARAQSHMDLDAANLAKNAARVNATTRRGHTQARVENYDDPVRLDFGVIFEHVQQVIHDLSHHEMLIDAQRILRHPTVQKAIYDTYGDQVYKQLKDGLVDIAYGDVPATNAFEKSINHIRQGATVAGLAWNATTAALQPLGLTQSMVRIGPKWVGRGLARWTRDAVHLESSARWIAEKSTLMRLRAQTQQREISEIRNQVGVNTGRLSGWIDEALRTTTFDKVHRQAIADSFFSFIRGMQMVADIPTWLGAYEKAMAGGETEERAIALADQAVLDSQGGGQIKDLSAVQRGGPMLKLWTNFYSFFNTTYNLTVEETRRTRFTHPAEVGRLAVDYVLLYIVPASLGLLLREALKPGDSDEDLAEALIRDNLAYLAGTMLGTRELSSAIQGYSGYEGPAGARLFASGSRLARQVEQGEADAAFWRALNDTAGVILHYPAGQVKKTADGFAALVDGQTRNPLVLLTGPER